MTMAQYQQKVDKWVRDVPDAVKDALEAGGNIVIGEAQTAHLSGPKMAKGVGSLTHATLQPRSGDLKTRLHKRVRATPGDVSLRVGSNMEYAAAHEYGYPPGGIPKRPFLRPSVDKKLSKILDLIGKRIVKAYREAGYGGF